MKFVEQSIKVIETKVFKELAKNLNVIEKINNSNMIEPTISKIISDTNDNLSADSISSWNKTAGKAVISNIISKGT